jgi:hypothetical protein
MGNKGRKMSYEGYVQILCEEGHYSIRDTYNDVVPENFVCKCQIEPPYDNVCGARMAWWNQVNLTNGSWEVNPETGKEERIDGFVWLEILEEGEVCEHCGNKMTTDRYKIPEDKGRKV